MQRGQFKPNAALARDVCSHHVIEILDFMMRGGFLTPEDEAEIMTRMHGRFELENTLNMLPVMLQIWA